MPNLQLPPELPLPSHFDPATVGVVWRVPYEARAAAARAWAARYGVTPAAQDRFRIALVGIDIQNTFCIPGFELYVAGRSGTGAVDDNRRLVAFIYRNLARITHITVTLDTHQAMQIFHAIFLVDAEGRHPAPYTLVSVEDVVDGRWRFNPAVAPSLGIEPAYGQRFLEHYTRRLRAQGKYELTIWPYHAMLGGLGHALVPAVEEAVFYHTLARQSQASFTIKGDNPLTESYSAIGPEVLAGPEGEPVAVQSAAGILTGDDESTGQKVAVKNTAFLHALENFDVVAVAGQAKSHCLAWTVDDLLGDLRERRPDLVRKVYLLEDCTSPVVVPGADYTEAADAAFKRFAEAGMHVVRSTSPIESWPGVEGSLSAYAAG